MGNSVFRSGGLLLSVNRDNGKVSEATAEKIETIFDVLRANPKISIQRLEALLQQVPKHENILTVHDNLGYNLLQKSVGLNHIELVKWILARPHTDVNRFPCSLPLHIACIKGYIEIVELLLKHGARLDTEARMCFAGAHSRNCEEMGKYKGDPDAASGSVCDRQNATKLQNCISYAIDGDQVHVLNILSQKLEEPWGIFRNRKPLLHLACERGAWNCVQHIVTTRSDEINMIKDEYYPIHQAVLHDGRFLELLIQHEASTIVRTSIQQMTLLHVVILIARKSADDTLQTLKVLLDSGCKELINAPDYLGNTPLHFLIVRYSLEEPRYGYDKWSKYDILNLVRFILQNGGKQSINQQGNSALACVFRHIRDWEVCYELVNMLLKEGGDANMVGRDGSLPLMVCLVPLINKDPLHSFTHTMKVFYLNCIRILLNYGANPNCSLHSNLTPLHVLIFTVSENFTVSVNCDNQKRANFDFIKNILLLLLQHGLDCSATSKHNLQSIMEMVQNVRSVSTDILCIYELTLTILQYGGDPNVILNNKQISMMINAVNDALSAGSSNQQQRRLVAPKSDNSDSWRTSSFRNNPKNQLLFYYVMLITRKEFILMHPDRDYTKLIYLFYFTMQHDVLYQCLKRLYNFFIVQVPSKSTEHLVNLIVELYRRPRSLKEMCRVTIYESLNRKLANNINRLNLPLPLKEYVLNFDH